MTPTPPNRITYVGHATVLAEIEGARLLTDPVLRSRVGPLRRHGSPPPAGVGAGLDAVLISHLHHDHADLPSLRRLDRELPLLVPPGAAALFERRGFARVTELAPGSSTRVGAVTVTAVEASHSGERRGFGSAAAVGYLLEGRQRVYFAGDTDIFDGMAELGELDLALLPVWAGARASAPATSTPSAPPRPPPCLPRAWRCRSTGARSTPGACAACAPSRCARRRASSRPGCATSPPRSLD